MKAYSSRPGQPDAYQPPAASAGAALLWGLLSLCAFIAVVALLVVPLGQLQQLVPLSHPAWLGVWAFSWVLGGGLLALAAARLVFRSWSHVRADAWLLLVVGAILSAAQVAILADWTIARFGVNDAELVGPMALLYGVIAGVSVAGFGVLVAPRGAAWVPFLAVASGAALGLLIVLSNAPGLADGLATDSRSLAVVTLASTTYLGAAGFVTLRRLLRA